MFTYVESGREEKKNGKVRETEEVEGFQKRWLFTRLNGRGSSKGARRPPPLIPALNTAISTSQLHSTIPHFKGKISLGRLFDELASRTAVQMENNATFAHGRSNFLPLLLFDSPLIPGTRKFPFISRPAPEEMSLPFSLKNF